jgi:prophage regulatory protein
MEIILMRILRKKEVLHITGLSKSTIYAKIKEGTFPKQIILSVRSVGWFEHEIQDWLKSRASETRAA